MNRTTALVCGVVDALFLAFHLLLAFWIQHMPVPPDLRALLHAFNIGGLLLTGFLAFAFLLCRDDLATRLGRGAVALGALIYLTRAAAELVLFPVPKPAILATCIIAGILHLLILRPAARTA